MQSVTHATTRTSCRPTRTTYSTRLSTADHFALHDLPLADPPTLSCSLTTVLPACTADHAQYTLPLRLYAHATHLPHTYVTHGGEHRTYHNACRAPHRWACCLRLRNERTHYPRVPPHARTHAAARNTGYRTKSCTCARDEGGARTAARVACAHRDRRLRHPKRTAGGLLPWTSIYYSPKPL